MTAIPRHGRLHGSADLTPNRWHRVDTVRTAAVSGGALIDLIAVEAAVNGRRVDLTGPEQYRAARELAARGYGPREIARRVGAEERRVQRWSSAGWPATQPGGDR